MPELNQPTNNLDELYQATEVAKPEFFQLVERIAQITGGQAVIASLKNRERAEAKYSAEYGGNAAEIRDLLRASIHYKSLKQIYQGLEQLKAEGVEVLLLKNRFLHPTRSGYRDALMNIRTRNGVIAELQLHLEQILVAKQEGHKYYEQEQELSRRSKLENRNLTPDESRQVEAIRTKQKELYEAAFLQAQVEEGTQSQGLTQNYSTQDQELESPEKQQQFPELNQS